MKKVMKVIAALMLMTAVFFTSECLNAQTHNGHDYVDLGLPSGTLWATCNVGATTPEGFGDYFAWGETQPKTTYSWSAYKYANGSEDKLTKYCNKSDKGNNGFIDNLKVLQTNDDAATANWGSGWRTPTKEDWEELKDNTTSKGITTRNGVKGWLFTASNGNSLFLPLGGDAFMDNNYGVGYGDSGYYWSSSLDTSDPTSAMYFFILPRDNIMYSKSRRSGVFVRAVRSAK